MSNHRLIHLRPHLVAAILLVNISLVNTGLAQHLKTGNAFPSYYLRSTNFPSFGHLWTLNGLGDGEAQGVAHDNENWYFTWTYNNVGYLIKVPVNIPLTDRVLQDLRVKQVKSDKYLELKGFWHWGDPDHYRYAGTDYIVIPIGTGTPRIAIFRADMTLAAYGILSNQQSTGWCAIHPQTGELFTSEDFDYSPPVPNCDDQSHHFLYPRKLLHYLIPWDRIPHSGYVQIQLGYNGFVEILTSNGKSMEIYNMQGGEFTPHGELLYISSGSGCCLGHGHGQEFAYDGLHVFDTQTWKEVIRSFNHSPRFPFDGPRYFDYFYPLGCGGGNCSVGGEAASWSPEGLTIWNLDDGRAPGISGQLHVLLFKFRKFGANREVFEHFGRHIYVNPITGIDKLLLPCLNKLPSPDDAPLPGNTSKPFKTVDYAVNSYPAWYGAQIAIMDGSNPKPSIMTMQGILAYKIASVPRTMKHGQTFPDLSMELYNFSSPRLIGPLAIDFFLSPDPVMPDSLATLNDIDLGTITVNVHLEQKGIERITVSGLKIPSDIPLGKYYIGTSVNGGPASSSSNVTWLEVTP